MHLPHSIGQFSPLHYAFMNKTYPDNLLHNILAGRANTSDGKENIVFTEEVLSQQLNLFGECRREHACYQSIDLSIINQLTSKTISLRWHTGRLNNLTNLWFETHVQHTISLVEHQRVAA